MMLMFISSGDTHLLQSPGAVVAVESAEVMWNTYVRTLGGALVCHLQSAWMGRGLCPPSLLNCTLGFSYLSSRLPTFEGNCKADTAPGGNEFDTLVLWDLQWFHTIYSLLVWLIVIN